MIGKIKDKKGSVTIKHCMCMDYSEHKVSKERMEVPSYLSYNVFVNLLSSLIIFLLLLLS